MFLNLELENNKKILKKFKKTFMMTKIIVGISK